MVLGKVLLHVLDWYRILTYFTESDVTSTVGFMQLKRAYAYLPFAEGREERGRESRGREEGGSKGDRGRGEKEEGQGE